MPIKICRFLLIACLMFSLGLCDCKNDGSADDDQTDDDATDDDTGDDDTDSPDDDDDDVNPPDSRSFALAAAPMQYEIGEWSAKTIFDTTGFTGLVDVLSLHMDGFFGLPWDQFAANQEPPAVWVAEMEAIRQQAQDLGVDIFLSITPLDGMRGALTPLAHDVGGELVIEPEGEHPCYNFDSATGPGSIREAYKNYVRWMVDFFSPKYLCHVIEMNIFADNCPDSYSSLINLANEVYNLEKGIDPDLVVFNSSVLNLYWGYYEEGGCEPGDHSCFQQSLARDAGILRDRFGISSYPQFYISYFGEIPDDYFTAVSDLTGEQIVFAEIGSGSYPVTFPHPGPDDPCTTLFDWSEGRQIALMERIFQDADVMEADLLCWWSLRDFLPDFVSTRCPCDAPDLWCIIYEAISDMGLLPSWLMWGSMGILDYDLNEKPLYDKWTEWLERPIKQDLTKSD